MLTLLFVGDINLGRMAGRFLESQPSFYPFEYVEKYIKQANLACGNLESQIANTTLKDAPWYILMAPPRAAEVLKIAGFDYLSLANNHSWDARIQGITGSLFYLRKFKIGFSGTGKSPYMPYITSTGNTTIAIFSVTAISNWGFTPEERKYVARANEILINEIKRIREKVDLIIVSYHGDEEYRFYPTKHKIQFARKCIDAGADIFWGHHPHYIQGEVFYKNKLIAFSLGNFVFAQRDPNARISYILKVHFDASSKRITGLEHIPIKAGFKPYPLPEKSKERERVLKILKEISSFPRQENLIPWHKSLPKLKYLHNGRGKSGKTKKKEADHSHN